MMAKELEKSTAGKLSKPKIIIFIASLFIAIIAGAASYVLLSKCIDPSEMAQKISFANETGLVKLKLYSDCASIAGVAFCISAILLLIFARRAAKKIAKGN